MLAKTTPPNLFAAAKAYAKAMTLLLPEFGPGGVAATVAMPFYLLAGFSVELSLKAVVLRQGGDVRELRSIGHDLNRALRRAQELGLEVRDGRLPELVSRLSSPHREHIARYVPDEEVIYFPRAELVMEVLAEHLVSIEQQVDVWCDAPA